MIIIDQRKHHTNLVIARPVLIGVTQTTPLL